jgi:hypothetical protein
MKKRELEAIHQLSKNTYDCIGDAYGMLTEYDQLEIVLGNLDLAK